MKRLALGTFLGTDPQDFQRWALAAFQEIEQASVEDAEQIIAEFTVENFTETRTLDASTATVGQLANFVATLVSDIQKRGQKRAYV